MEDQFRTVASLGTFAGFMFEQQAILAVWVKLLSTVVLIVTFLVYTFLWKVEVKERNRSDKKLVQYYWNKLNEELGMQPPLPTPQKPMTHLSQVMITLMVVLLAALSVWV